jgi:hypothetical protein
MDSRSRKLHSRGGLEHLPKCISLVAEAARRAMLSSSRHQALEAATREAYLAIVQGDPHDSRRGPVEVEVAWDRDSVTVSLTHAGPGLERLFEGVPADPRVVAMRHSLDEVSYAQSTRDGHRLLLRAHVEGGPERRASVHRASPGKSGTSR